MQLPGLKRGMFEFVGVPDDALLRLYVQERNESAFEVLVHRHEKLVWSVCYRMTRDSHMAHDAAQVTFLALAKNAASIRNGSHLTLWLHRVAVNAAQQIRKRQRPLGVSLPQSESEQPAAPPSSCEEDYSAVIDQLLSQLPERERFVVVRHYLEGMTQSEIARQMGVRQSTVSRRLERALERRRQNTSLLGAPALLATLSNLHAQTGTGSPAGLAQSSIGMVFGPTTAVSNELALIAKSIVPPASRFMHLKWAIAVFSVGVFGASIVSAYHPSATKTSQRIASEADKVASPSPTEVAGRVVSGEGKTKLFVDERTRSLANVAYPAKFPLHVGGFKLTTTTGGLRAYPGVEGTNVPGYGVMDNDALAGFGASRGIDGGESLTIELSEPSCYMTESTLIVGLNSGPGAGTSQYAAELYHAATLVATITGSVTGPVGSYHTIAATSSGDPFDRIVLRNTGIDNTAPFSLTAISATRMSPSERPRQK